MTLRGLLIPAFAALFPAITFADFTATGTCLYRDREFDETGFTGIEPNLPIRFADVEVVDDNAPASNHQGVGEPGGGPANDQSVGQ